MTEDGDRQDLRFEVDGAPTDVSAILCRPADATALLVLAHGAGAGIRHVFLESLVTELSARGIATLRYQFPYMEIGGRPPDRPPRLTATVRAAIETARSVGDGLPILAGGKSMGGRMTSTLLSEHGGDFPYVRGIVFYGFPLHPPRKPSDTRGAHLFDVRHAMLFLQGTRDALADLSLLEPVCTQLGDTATLHVVEGADHSFHVLKRSGRTDAEVLGELADETARFAASRVAGEPSS